MRKLIGIIGLAALLAGITGCSTTPTGQKVPDVKAMSAVAQSAAAIGSMVWLEHNPGDRATFEQVRTGLRILIASGTFQASDLTTLLRQLPIKELKGDSGTLIVGTAVTLWDVYGRQLTDLDKAQVFATYVLPVAQAILAGLDQGMGGPPK